MRIEVGEVGTYAAMEGLGAVALFDRSFARAAGGEREEGEGGEENDAR